MVRGNSLVQDLRLLINNPKYSDIEILCGDGIKLHGCRAILATRSEKFDNLLYNEMKKTHENQISFSDINSAGMKIILEYIYTGSVKEEYLTRDDTVEAFYAACHFQLSDLQNFIVKTVETNLAKIYSPELLSKISEKMPLSEDNALLNLLVEKIAIMPLNKIEFGRLSITGLKYLLSHTHDKEVPFATQEYEVFRYSAILAAKQVSNEAYESLLGRLPTFNEIEDSVKVENKQITDLQKVSKEIEPLIKYIDFRRIKGQVLVDYIEPLEIVPAEKFFSVYRYMTRLNSSDLNDTRGIPIMMYVFDESACGSKLIINDSGKIVQAPDGCGHQSVRTKIAMEDDGIYEWDVIIEKICTYAWVGVCAENLNYETFAGDQPTGWVIGSSGEYANSAKRSPNYCPVFADGTKITVHLDMNKRTCAFTVNGTKYREISEWNLPSKLYPVVSLAVPGRFRIEPHQKS
ncbi:hypothetical protein RclHR1_03050006 [Rhizophagus clarus]|uniref:BTB domain-containing protein n=1 Tax=Rhizophagus clarus TaxID=94130 RepID=A0A2Z6R5M0_9GLOM|nr:hypothetical protein RclHR1_03050006 [Rhizophagus clarus]GES97509.1 hypothetical protein GLOIN_2v810536 [Rhizophagus clarus]